MPIYECKKCNFITDIKTHYERHVNTNKHQRNMGEIEVEKGIPKVSFKYHLSIPEVSKTTQESILYECDYCDATFKHINNKYRHQKHSCKAKKTLEEKDKRIEELEKKLYDALLRIGNITNNNTTNNNNINNSRNLNITINAYGQEDISYLKDGDWLKMLTKPQDSIVNLFLETHFNPEHPENSNIRLRNRNSKFLEVHDGDNWKNKKKKKMLSDIADDKQGILDDRYAKDEELQNEMTERQRSGHAYFHDEMYYNNKKEIMDEMEGVLLDNK